MRYFIPLLLAAALPLSGLAEGLGTTVHHGPAAKHLTLAGAKQKKAKVKKSRKAKKAPRAKKAPKGKKRAASARKSGSSFFSR